VRPGDYASKNGVRAADTQPATPETPRRVDDEYKRCGTANIFAAVEPLTGSLIVQATERRASIDCAHFLKKVIDEGYPEATKVVFVMDNLSTHTPACLYEAFAPAEARRLVKKIEIHYTPKHGSWLNVAEIQFSVMARQCLDQRIGSLAQLIRILRAWQDSRKPTTVSWQFTTENARIKLCRLYPPTQ
jgi:transposase